jgi:hypothetical protein
MDHANEKRAYRGRATWLILYMSVKSHIGINCAYGGSIHRHAAWLEDI